MTILTQSIYFDDPKLELEELLIKNLPSEINAGNEKEKSNFFKVPTKYALAKCAFIHYNSKEIISFMIFDFDKVEDKTAIEAYPTIELFLEYLVEKIGLEPTFITQTEKGYHFAYSLKNWVYTHQKKPLIYLNAIKDAIIDRVGCDIYGSTRNYGIWRNPLLHNHYFSSCFNYELKDFKDLTIPKKSIQKEFNYSVATRQISRGLLTVGNRNFGLYLLGMKFAKNKKNLEKKEIEFYLRTVNNSIEKPLPEKEIIFLAKSIYNNYYLKDKIYIKGANEDRNINEGIMGFKKISNLSTEEYNIEVKRRQSLAAKRTNEILNNKTSNLEIARETYRKKCFTINLNKVREAEKNLIENNEKVNISKISKTTGLDRKTVKKYFDFPRPDY